MHKSTALDTELVTAGVKCCKVRQIRVLQAGIASDLSLTQEAHQPRLHQIWTGGFPRYWPSLCAFRKLWDNKRKPNGALESRTDTEPVKPEMFLGSNVRGSWKWVQKCLNQKFSPQLSPFYPCKEEPLAWAPSTVSVCLQYHKSCYYGLLSPLFVVWCPSISSYVCTSGSESMMGWLFIRRGWKSWKSMKESTPGTRQQREFLCLVIKYGLLISVCVLMSSYDL